MNARHREDRKFDGLATPLAVLGRLTRSQTSFTQLAAPFFVDFFSAIDECLLAMEMRTKGKMEARHEVAARHLSSWVFAQTLNIKGRF